MGEIGTNRSNFLANKSFRPAEFSNSQERRGTQPERIIILVRLERIIVQVVSRVADDILDLNEKFESFMFQSKNGTLRPTKSEKHRANLVLSPPAFNKADYSFVFASQQVR